MGPILFVLFIVVPLLELLVIIQVGQLIGAPYTVLLLLAISLAGAALVKREGLRAWQRFRQALAEGRVPAKEVVDGALLLFGGALLLTPGFLTDAVGLALLVPLARTGIRRLVRGRIQVLGEPAGRRQGHRGAHAPRSDPPSARPRDAEVVDVEVVEIKRDEGPRDR